MAGEARERGMDRVASLVGATHVIVGQLHVAGRIVRAEARLVDVTTREVVAGWHLVAHAPIDDLMGLQDEIICSVLAASSGKPDTGSCDAATLRVTGNGPALMDYSKGYLALYQGRMQSAWQSFQDAWKRDPNFNRARDIRDAIFWSAIPGNQWTYDQRVGLSVAEGRASVQLRLVRQVRVPLTPSGAPGEIFYELAQHRDSWWGNCAGEATVLVDIAGGWVRVLSIQSLQTCAQADRAVDYRTTYDPPLPYLPLDPEAAMARPLNVTIRKTVSLAGVANEKSTHNCVFTVTRKPKTPTPIGVQDASSVSSKCRRLGTASMDEPNRNRARQWWAATQARAREVRATTSVPKLLLMSAKERQPRLNEVPPQLNSNFGIHTDDREVVFVPGVGVLREIQNFVGDYGDLERGEKRVRANTALVGVKLEAFAPAPLASAGGKRPKEARPVVTFGDVYAPDRTGLDEGRGYLALGLLAIAARPRFDKLRLSFPDGSQQLLSAGDGIAFGGGYWIADMWLLAGELRLFAWGFPTDKSQLEQRYGKKYQAWTLFGFEARTALRLSSRGWLSVPRLEAGFETQVVEVSNKDGDKTGEFGDSGERFSHHPTLNRGYGSLGLTFAWHDRVIFSVNYRIAKYFGRFSLDSTTRKVDLLAHGPSGSLCITKQGTLLGSRGFGACVKGFLELPLTDSDHGSFGRDFMRAGAAFDLYMPY